MSEEDAVSVVGSQQNLVPVKSRKTSLKKKWRLERHLLAVVAILVILLVIFLVIIIILACQNKAQGKANLTGQPTCNSKMCIASAFSLLESMDRSADPCEDFYQFACGKWGRNHPVRDMDVSNTWFNERSLFLLRQLRDLLTSNITNSEPRAVRQAKSLLRACSDLGALEQLGLDPITQILQNLSLPKQIPNAQTARGWDIATTLALAQRLMSLDLLVQLSPDVDSTENGKIVLNLSPPTEVSTLIQLLVTDPENLPRAIRLNTREIVKAKMTFMMGMLEEMDSWVKEEFDEDRLNKSSIASAVFKILLFGADVSHGITIDDANSSSSSTVQITIQELQRLMDFSSKGAKNNHKINWKQYFTVLTDGIEKPFNKSIETVTVTDLAYFVNLASVIANSRLETIQRYVWWQVLEVLAPHTNKVMRDLRNQLLEHIYGTLPIPSRSTLCLRRVKKLLPMAVSYTFAVQDDVANTVSKVSEMLQDIKTSFNSLVHNGDWIDPETKKAAQEKAEGITSFIGYQEWLLKPGQLDERYSSLNLEDNEYLWNILRIKSKEVQDFLRSLLYQSGKQKNDSWNDIDPLQVNAYYSRTENAIIIPAGILQFPFYDRGLEALNYGSIGSILGHELTHGFDIEGKNYWKDGSKVSWWNADMLKAYEERAKCFVDKYSQYGSGSSKLDGLRTLAENIADNGGIREAYRGYQRYKERHDVEQVLPGLEEFSHDQLLFLAFANIWCLDEGPDYEALATKDSHSPGKYRVLGSLSNSPEFSETWNCPLNSPMNPSDRCIIW
ncbi:endothelin-converting enzyme homolog isoform X2 [Zootermopsis nevadensis]|uniref:endothelin-converting enzyme homolog isoform X2 n=1 Tax=Zootermopsis nevadensis TaxID=136037 RepID=UPI000B8EABB9|nr:endothelin-converting enzyme homolog isoform X2 [Zootermopsis nevadensis]